MVKKDLEKLISPVKWSVWLDACALENFAARHFFDVSRTLLYFHEKEGKLTEQNLKGKLEFNVMACLVTAR